MKVQASHKGFKKVLESLHHIDRLNFIWMYDQYVQTQCEISDGSPVVDTIEDFYFNIYKPQIQKEFSKSYTLRAVDPGH